MYEEESWDSEPMHAALGKTTHMSLYAIFQGANELGIHPGQIPICAYVYFHDGCRQKEMAEALHIKPSTVSVSIERMEKNGLLEKRQDPVHSRISHIHATEKLREAYQKLGELMRENEETMMQGFTPEERERLRQDLRRIQKNLQQAKEMTEETTKEVPEETSEKTT